MIIKNGTNWSYILVVIIFTAFVGRGIFFWQNFWLTEDLSAIELSMIPKPVPKPNPKPVPLPTEINPNFLNQVEKCFIPAAAVYGYNLRITSGFRSLSEQDQIFDQGRTEDGHIVSWAIPGKSLHNYGLAVDVADRRRGYYINWKRLKKIGAFCSLEQVDDAHFENRGGLTTDQFAAGLRPAPLALPCALLEERSQASQKLTFQDLENCGALSF